MGSYGLVADYWQSVGASALADLLDFCILHKIQSLDALVVLVLLAALSEGPLRGGKNTY